MNTENQSTATNIGTSSTGNTTTDTADDPFLTLFKNIFNGLLDCDINAQSAYTSYNKDFGLFLDVIPEETYEHIEIFITYLILKKYVRHICYYFTYKELDNLENYVFEKEYISSYRYIKLYESNKKSEKNITIKT